MGVKQGLELEFALTERNLHVKGTVGEKTIENGVWAKRNNALVFGSQR